MENLEELVGVAGEFDANRQVEGESELAFFFDDTAATEIYTGQPTGASRPLSGRC